MHNIDRTLQEYEAGPALAGEYESYETGPYGQELEYAQQAEYGQELGQEFEQEFTQQLSGETFELSGEQELLAGELAQELLEVSNEQELNHFLGGLLQKAAGAASQLLTSPAGQSVGRYLADVAQNTLPQLAARYGGQAGAALGSRLGPAGARLGQQLGARAGRWVGQQAGNWAADNAQRVFGLELEALSPESHELEISGAYVRFALDVARRAERLLRRHPRLSVGALGRHVLNGAAPRYAPGLLAGGLRPAAAGAARGTWERRGRTIVLFGA